MSFESIDSFAVNAYFLLVDLEKSPKVKVLGRRVPSAGGLKAANALFKLVLKLRGSKPFFPRGVYRFKSYEEKERWEHLMRAR
ncbi:MAG: hypothetical protein KDK66_03840 [Deltaproteobacteria bacterium]|nr:hypothetical protein [Deltaproteobacteria bacterium]